MTLLLLCFLLGCLTGQRSLTPPAVVCWAAHLGWLHFAGTKLAFLGGQDVHRRVGAAIGIAVFTLGIGALMALTKSKKHYVGLTWADGDKKGGFAMQCDKNDYRGVLAGLEGITGKKAVDSEAMTVKN